MHRHRPRRLRHRGRAGEHVPGRRLQSRQPLLHDELHGRGRGRALRGDRLQRRQRSGRQQPGRDQRLERPAVPRRSGVRGDRRDSGTPGSSGRGNFSWPSQSGRPIRPCGRHPVRSPPARATCSPWDVEGHQSARRDRYYFLVRPTLPKRELRGVRRGTGVFKLE
jgi:hypothetical protein